MWKFSIDIAERNGALLRRRLRSALEVERVARAHYARRPATALCSRCHENAPSKAYAQKKQNPPLAKLATPLSGGHKSDGSARALFGAKGGADRGDQLLRIDRLVDAIDEARGHQAPAPDLPEGGEPHPRGIAPLAAGGLDPARPARRLAAGPPPPREVAEPHGRAA